MMNSQNDEAEQKSSSVLSVTHTDPYTFRRSTFAGHACAVRTDADVASVLRYMSESAPWSNSSVKPCAWRLDSGVEGSDDAGDVGAGEKLLHLLQRWDVKNVVLVVTRHDSDSLHGGGFLASEKLGVQRYRIMLSKAKHVLEQCYLTALRAAAVPHEANTVPMPGIGGTSAPGASLRSSVQRTGGRRVFKPADVRFDADIVVATSVVSKRGQVNRFDCRTP